MITESPDPIKGHSRVVFNCAPVRYSQQLYLSLDITHNLLFLSTCWNFHLSSSITLERILSSVFFLIQTQFQNHLSLNALLLPQHVAVHDGNDVDDVDDADDDSDALALSLQLHGQTSGLYRVRSIRKERS